jgi:hypothetical protein
MRNIVFMWFTKLSVVSDGFKEFAHNHRKPVTTEGYDLEVIKPGRPGNDSTSKM